MKDNMKKLFTVSLLAIAFSACAAEDAPLQSSDAINSPANNKEVADAVVAWSAGYCKAQTEKQGVDFAICFKQTTNIAIEKIQKMQAAQPSSR